MSNSFMRSSYFQTQVNNANVIKNCYPCGSNCTVISGGCSCSIPSDLTLSTLTVNGLIEASGLQFNPVLINPGDNPATTIWSNAMDMNKLYYGAAAVGGGGVASVTGGTNISTSGTATDPVINFNPGGVMNMNGAYLTNVSSISSLSSNIAFNSSYLGLETRGINTEIYNYDAMGTTLETRVTVDVGGKLNIIGGGNIGGIRFEGQGGKGGDLYADEGTGSVQLVAGGGLALNVESASAINIATSAEDTTISLLANGGSASVLLQDTSTIGAISLDASTITIKNSAGADPVLRFDNPAATGYQTIDVVYQALGNYDGIGPALIANCLEMGIAEGGSNTGALRIGTTSSENYVYGGGYPLRIKQSAGDNKEIRFDVNPSQQISINVDTGNLNLQGTNITAGSSSGSSGTFLIINVNGTPYKLDLHNI